MVSVITAASGCLEAQVTPAPQSAAPAAAPASPASGPIIQFDNAVYDFGKVAYGEKARHTYMVSNAGNETLEITNVKPGCHCTTAGDWTHSVEPGKTGEIPVQFDSTGFNGPITRTIDVYSNARNAPRKTLQLKGLIWKPIDFSPTAFLSISPDATNEISTKVRIVNQTDDPVTFSNAVSANKIFQAELKETRPGKEYELDITLSPPFPVRNTSGTITVNTSRPGTPTITVTATASVTPAIQVSPSQIVLNSLPDRAMTNLVTILANTTNLLSLSNPKSSDSRIQVEVQPGARKGMFKLLVVVPPGFQLEPGQKPEVTVESNHPRFPLIRVPIIQFPHRQVAALPGSHNSTKLSTPVWRGAFTNGPATAVPAPPAPAAGHP
jgi:hypothetical protein